MGGLDQDHEPIVDDDGEKTQRKTLSKNMAHK